MVICQMSISRIYVMAFQGILIKVCTLQGSQGENHCCSITLILNEIRIDLIVFRDVQIPTKEMIHSKSPHSEHSVLSLLRFIRV